MRAAYQWLGDFVSLDNLSPKEVLHALTMSGSEVEKSHLIGTGIEKVVVGKAKQVKDHPNADKLTVVKVDIGGGKELQVVCGASNVAAGQVVPVVLVGGKVKNSRGEGFLEVKKVKLRGVESSGMICSPKELGLANMHKGILVLDDSFNIGEDFIPYLKDCAFSLEITPNRGDCLSILGLSREVACLFERDLNLDEEQFIKPTLEKQENPIIKIKALQKCSRYVGILIEGIEVKKSPFWLRKRLMLCGIRPVNLVVDITNYVMWELGQPLHAFDADKLFGKKEKEVEIRKAKKGEFLITLDGEKRELNEENLLITSHDQPVALAGVMGGENSEVSSQTERILLESAYFDPVIVRRSSQVLGLRSEASSRFEKGVDFTMVIRAAHKVVYLLKKFMPANVVGYTDAQAPDAEKIFSQKNITLSAQDLKRLVGLDFKKKRVEKILSGLGFVCQLSEENGENWILQVTVPSWRDDVNVKEDLIEEVARIYGYSNIPASVPKGPYFDERFFREINWEQQARQKLKSFGLYETYNFSFLTEDEMTKWNLDKEKHLNLSNPLAGFESMRQSLLPNLAEVLEYNISQFPRLEEVGFFELARTYFPKEGEELPRENVFLTFLLAQKKSKDEQQGLFLKSREIVESLLYELGIKDSIFSEEASLKKFLTWPGFLEISASVEVEKEILGFGGGLNFKKRKSLDLNDWEIVFWELNFDLLKQKAKRTKCFQPFSDYPPAFFSAAFIFDEATMVADIRKVFEEMGQKEKIDVICQVVDIYRGKGIEEGKKSIAFEFVFQPHEHTIESKKLESLRAKVVGIAQKEFGAVLRGQL